MQRKKKSLALEQPVPNFTGHAYSDVVQDFSEHDRLMESEISQLICSDEYQLERTLNSFNDGELNDHLYHLFYSKKTKNIALMRRWISYYVRQYPKQITIQAKPYLDSKKLTLEDWLRCVKEGRRGDILCVFLLSLSTGVHTVVHLKNNKLWCTLKTLPETHSELLSICDQHLIYLGLGIFIRLERKPIQERILGTITGADDVTHQLLLQSMETVDKSLTYSTDSAISNIQGVSICPDTKTTTTLHTAKRLTGSNTQLTGTTQPSSIISSVQGKPKASAAAGSEEQLPRLEAELSGITPPRLTCAQTTTCTQLTSLGTPIPSLWRKR